MSVLGTIIDATLVVIAAKIIIKEVKNELFPHLEEDARQAKKYRRYLEWEQWKAQREYEEFEKWKRQKDESAKT